MDLLPTHEFVISCIGYLENIGSLNFAHLPDSTFFTMQEQNVTFVNIAINLIRTVFKYWEAVKLRVAYIRLP